MKPDSQCKTINDPAQLQEAIAEQARALIAFAERELAVRLPVPEIRFDLRGQAAGQAHLRGAFLRFNPILLEENPEAFMAQTVPHEVAHVVVGRLFPRARPHGEEWKQVMRLFGADPQRCHQFDTSRATTRRLRRFTYRCDCREHALTTIRHNRVKKGMRYLCRDCGSALRRAED